MHVTRLVLELLDQEGWSYERLEAQSLIRVRVEGTTGRWPCLAVANDNEDRLVIYGVCPFVVPAERRLPMAEFLTRANFGLPVGNLELDLEDGELRVRTSIDFEDGATDAKLIRNLFYINIALMDQHLPALEALVAGVEPKVALERIGHPS